MPTSQYSPISILSRYLLSQFFAFFLPITASFILLYVLVDLFDRLDILLRYHASTDAALRYFVFKIPLMLTQITPPAVITSVLLSLGIMNRRNEIVAFRASGVSLSQTAVPIIIAAILISFAALGWNETVVPYSSRKFQYVNNIEIRKRAQHGLLSDHELWYHGATGFYNVDYVDRDRRTIQGLTIYRLSKAFRLESVIYVPTALWDGRRWHPSGAVEHHLGSKGDTDSMPLGILDIPETLDDFLAVQREPEELSFSTLRQRVAELTRKGIDASHYLVDLYLKLALPFSSTVLAAVAIPIGGALRNHSSIATSIGTGTAVGFAYWVVLGLANSLGHSGALPPVIAAWAANGIFLLIALALYLYVE
jgi:lipopolysaccharide export system permease protein